AARGAAAVPLHDPEAITVDEAVDARHPQARRRRGPAELFFDGAEADGRDELGALKRLLADPDGGAGQHLGLAQDALPQLSGDEAGAQRPGEGAPVLVEPHPGELLAEDLPALVEARGA